MVKKFVLVIFAVVLSMGICAAQESAQVAQSVPEEVSSDIEKAPMAVEQENKKEPGSKDGMKDKMRMMMQKSMVASTDGGVIILAGNKLLKYDSKLNLVKEVEIKVECPAMGKMPMMGMNKAKMKMKEGQ